MKRLDPENKKDTGIDLPEYGRLLWKKRNFIILPVILAGLITVVGVQFLKPVYKSSSLIRLEDPDFVNEELAQFLSVQERRQAVDEETLARIRTEIRSSGFVDRVVAHLGLAENPQAIQQAELLRNTRHPDMAVDEILRHNLGEILENKIKVGQSGPGIFEIACYDYTPQNCFMLADAVTELFIDSQRQRKLKGLEEASEFSDEQLQVYKRRLEESEAELQRVQERVTRLALQSNPVGETSKRYQEEFGGESNLRYAETLQEGLNIEIAEMEDIIARTADRLTTLLGSAPAAPSAFMQAAEVSKLRSSLMSYRQTQLRLELGAQGVTTKDLDANHGRIRETEQALERQLMMLVDNRYNDVDLDYRPLIVEYYLQSAMVESLRSKRVRLEEYIESFKRKVDLAPRLDAELAKLQEQVKTDRELYNSFLRAKTSTQIGQAAQNTNLALTVEVLEHAARPLQPVRPRKARILLLALILGASLGFAGLLVSEYTDTSFRNVEHIEKELGVRVLGTMPLITEESPWKKEEAGKQAMIWGGTAIAVIVLALAGFYFYGRMADKIVVSRSQAAQIVSPAGEYEQGDTRSSDER